jgi:hypothetical protein
MTINYQTGQGKRSQRVFSCSEMTWSGSTPRQRAIFTLQPLHGFDAFWRAEIVIRAMLAAYEILV